MISEYIWLIAGLAGLIAEVLMPGFFLLWLGLAALLTGIVHYFMPMLGLFWQVMLFALLSILCVGIGLRLRPRKVTTSINTAGAGLIGRGATALVFEGHEGRVRVGDSDWPATLAKGETPPSAGTRMLIVGVSGIKLVVQQTPG